MRQRTFTLTLMIVLTSCTAPRIENKEKYIGNVGDTVFDSELDDPSFVVCDPDNIFQYYNFGKGLQYKGEKSAIIEHFKRASTMKYLEGETGFVTIRFVVNCNGKTGWFRVQQMNYGYQERKFKKKIIDNLLAETKKA